MTTTPTNTPHRLSDVDSATEAIPAVPTFAAVPAQRSPGDRPSAAEGYRVMTVGEAAGARMWTRGRAPAPGPEVGSTGAVDPGAAWNATGDRGVPANPIPAAEPWPTTLSRRAEKKAAERKRRRLPWVTAGLAVRRCRRTGW
ncbi:hypothetical protein [Pseudonocardia xishanensis]|uniref:Uncharacterized protein n=1 Tax=Pseudonocardia xishanensis TaxID=630995 RepID=A0ABP8S5I8_9PSEU